MPPAPPGLLQMRAMRKSFSGVEVLRGVDFDLAAGEIHALVGENGAGKSTLIKILAGVHRDYTGTIQLDGRPVRWRGPRDAERRGLAVIHQELALVPHLSVTANMFLGRELCNRLGGARTRAMHAQAATALRERLGVSLDPRRRLAELPLAVQQLVEIAKNLLRDARILIMDEPTSALGDAETQRLFDIVRQLRDRGTAIIFISHKLEEIYALADRITVLRDGQHVGTAAAADLPAPRLVQWMVGRAVPAAPPRAVRAAGPERLRVDGLSLYDPDSHRWLVRDATLAVHAGEVVGLAGLIGSGTSALLGALYGRYGRPPSGRIWIDGRPLTRFTPRAVLARGVALLTNDRQATGLIPPLSVLHNISLAALARCTRAGLLSTARERRLVAPAVERLRLRAPGLNAGVTTLSGGNQQKALLARWLLAAPRVLLLDEPTRGIDVAAKSDLYNLLEQLTAEGLGILLITSELPELLALAHRVLVLHRGRMVAEFGQDTASQEVILHAAMGGETPRD